MDVSVVAEQLIFFMEEPWTPSHGNFKAWRYRKKRQAENLVNDATTPQPRPQEMGEKSKLTAPVLKKRSG